METDPELKQLILELECDLAAEARILTSLSNARPTVLVRSLDLKPNAIRMRLLHLPHRQAC